MEELDLKRAYEILGLPENASRDEVEKRYELLLRRQRAKKEINELEAFSEINRAYRFIVEYEHQQHVEAMNQEKYGKYKKYGPYIAKLDHFFSYYKWHLIGAIAVVALMIYSINSYIENREEQARLAALPPADLEMSFIGQFVLPQDQDIEALEQKILEQFPEWQRVEADVQTLNMDPQVPVDIAMQQKVIILLATESPDVYVLDRYTFEWIAKNGVLLPLEEEANGRLAPLLPEDAAMTAPDREEIMELAEGESLEGLPEYIYGINIASSPLAEELPLSMRDMVIGIRADTDQYDNAILLIERYLEALKEK